jgi:hypothetical protein
MATGKSSIDVQAVQDKVENQIEETTQTASDYSRKLQLIIMGAAGMAVDLGLDMMTASRELLAKMEKRGESFEDEIYDRVKALRQQASSGTRSMSDTVSVKIEAISDEIESRVDAAAAEAEEALESAKKAAAKG